MIEEASNDSRNEAHCQINQHGGFASDPYQEILDETCYQATDGRHARLAMSPSKEDHGTGGGHGRQYDQTTRVVADEQACPGCVLSFLGFLLEEQGFVNRHVSIVERRGNSHEHVLELGIVVIGHFSLKLKVAILHEELQLDHPQLPRHRQPHHL